MNYFNKNNGNYLIFILVLLVILIFAICFYLSYFKTAEGFAILSAPGVASNGISSIQDVLSLPGVAPSSLPSGNNWAMVNEITEPDGTVIQDIVNTDGTVLTITNSQNIINAGKSTPGNSNVTNNNNNSSNISANTYNRNTF